MASRKLTVVHRVGRALVMLGILLPCCSLWSPAGWAWVQETTSTGIPLSRPTAQATLNLRLGCPSNGSLPNWGPCWDDAAADVAARWNGAAVRFRFFRQSPPIAADPCAHTDQINTAAFQ